MIIDFFLQLFKYILTFVVNLLPATDFSVWANVPAAFLKFAQDLIKLNSIFPVDVLLTLIVFVIQSEIYYLIYKLAKGAYRLIRG